MVQFFRYGSPRTLTLGLLLAVGARLSVGEWTWWDALIVFGFLTFEPLQEWLIHVHVLHWRPRRVLGVHIDPYLARKHRAHHRNPWTVPTLFIPLRTLALSFAANVALWSLVAPTWPLFLTALTMLLVIGFGYEWTHYLIHTPYRPRTRLFKLLFQHHRLHHFKNEHYWMGVTSDLGDRLLGTRPDARTVELSPTARDLLGEGAAGA
ncbi:MAG: fatty acid hydroxylase family protein [Myxococcales bacterium]|nr:fatty acid hydroxylase family protein [Myxococcales bacterium]